MIRFWSSLSERPSETALLFAWTPDSQTCVNSLRKLGCPRCFHPVLIYGLFMNSSLGHRRSRRCRPALLFLWGVIFSYPVFERCVKNYGYADPCSSVVCFQSEKISVEGIVETLIRDKVVLLPRYWDTEHVELARSEVHGAVQECRQVVNRLDYRRLGVNELPEKYQAITAFANDPLITAVSLAFLNKTSVTIKAQAGLTLIGGDSGAGWHKDTIKRGFKALMYLNDVSQSGGPFQFLTNYQDKKLQHMIDQRGRNTRYSEGAINEQVQFYSAEVKSILAPAGSVVLFDISNVHRGAPCSTKSRAAMTLYVDTPLRSSMCLPGQNIYQEISTQPQN